MEINTNYPKIEAYSCEEQCGEVVVRATVCASNSADRKAFLAESLALGGGGEGVKKRLCIAASAGGI
jgi:hypothetical protein